MNKQYNHKEFEEKIYKKWKGSGSFSPSENKEAYTIIMPPPNANDPLHVGHAMFVTIEDIFIRYQRMRGKAALWLPGTDHAGIETQYVFEKKLKKEGKSRFNFDRATLYKMIWDYVEENSSVARDQLEKIGASADFTRFKFMLDEEIVGVVLDTFKQLDEDGLIYRDERLVNYCYKCGTAFSDLEVNYEEKQGQLYFVKYEVVGGEDLVLATTRPETIYADIAIAIHPNHPKAHELMGKKVINPLNGNHLDVVLDEAVDLEFGTGMLKITPFHDQTDFEIWERNKDKLQNPICVIGFDGKLTAEAMEFFKVKAHIAKPKIVEKLQNEGKIEKVESHTHSVGTCYRCKTVIEPLPLAQFFLKVKPLTEKVIQALDKNRVRVHGAGYDKILRHWLENLKDWNISRQIAWGIRMPIWYDYKKNEDIEVSFIDKNGEYRKGPLKDLLIDIGIDEIRAGLQELRAPVEAKYVISTESPGENYIQETDTFDTWFSSAQWPYSTLMTGKEGDFERFYPTNLMETGYDILPFWVMRMLMMGIYKTGKVPFYDVYLHGLVRDEKGQKMSKSKGNVINPLDVIEKYGADSLRMALVMSTSAGKDSNTGENKIKGMRNFTNKIWNAARYLVMADLNDSDAENKEYKRKLKEVISSITDHLENFRVGLAAEELYGEFWHWYCDEMIEKSKEGLVSKKEMVEGMVIFLKLLHPFVPFVTEAIFEELKNEGLLNKKEMLISSKWPE